MDIRPRFATVSGQEVLSADGVALKLSVAAKYEIVDPALAVNSAQDYQSALYLELHMGLRAIVGAAKVDEVLEKRAEMGGQLLRSTAGKAEKLGLRLLSVEVKDLMFPGELKKIFSQVVKARQESLAALEKARGLSRRSRPCCSCGRSSKLAPARATAWSWECPRPFSRRRREEKRAARLAGPASNPTPARASVLRRCRLVAGATLAS